MKKLVLAGGTGFIGRSIAHALHTDWEIVVLTRSDAGVRNGIRHVHWDGRSPGAWVASLDGAAAVINLSGVRIDRRFTAANRRLIRDSRVEATRAIGEAIRSVATPPPVWINAGTAGIYADRPGVVHDESSTAYGNGFLARVAVDWEAAIFGAAAPVHRRVVLRIPILLGSEGALPVLARLVRFGAGGRQGHGRQVMSWVHVDDLVRAVAYVLDNDALAGPVNVVAPGIVSNRAFMRTLRHVLRVPIGLPAPEPLMRIGGWLMGVEPSVALQGMNVNSARLAEAGFTFRFPVLEPALTDLLAPRTGPPAARIG